MVSNDFGNKLNQTIRQAEEKILEQGELAQLAYFAFDFAAKHIQDSTEKEFELQIPIGCNPDKTAMHVNSKYQKKELISQYEYLAFRQLSINSILQLVTIVETLLSDIVRKVIMRFPKKLGGKRNMPLKSILESSSIEEIYIKATDTLINELTYKSPTEFSEEIQQLLSINLLEFQAFQRYKEIKATRDIFVHNNGTANDIYIRKAQSHARAKPGILLPIDNQYFLESYENCLQITKWLEAALHVQWYSSEYEERKSRNSSQSQI